MAALAPVPAAAPAEVARIAPLKAAASGAAAPPDARAGQPPRGADQITLAPPPTARTLIDLATAGLRQLGTLLPALERVVGDAALDAAASPLGHLARALGDAAHSIDVGAAAMSAGKEAASPGPAAADAWRQTATGALHTAADLLTRAEQRLAPTEPPSVKPAPSPGGAPGRPEPGNPEPGSPQPGSPQPGSPGPQRLDPKSTAQPGRPGMPDLSGRPDAPDLSRPTLRVALRDSDPPSRADTPSPAMMLNPLQLAAPQPTVPTADMLWAMSQVVGAQRQIGLALASLSRAAHPEAIRTPTARRPRIDLRGALAVAGTVLLLLLLAVADAAGSVTAGLGGAVVAGVAALAWGWRVVISSRHLRLELRRSSKTR